MIMTNKRLKRGLFIAGILVVVTMFIGTQTDIGSIRHVFGKSVSPSGQSKKVNRSRPLTMEELLENRFQEREDLINETCHRSPYQELRFKKIPSFSSFARGRIKWCRTPKVGTTYLLSLEKFVFRKTLLKVDNDSLEHKTVMFVREPYSRLVSGYIGKIVTNQPWWKAYGTAIVKRFRTRPTEQAMHCGNDVSFPEFLKYFIDSQLHRFRRNVHFNPQYEKCNPCGMSFDFIGHLETIKDDLSFILDSVNASANVDFSDEEQTMRSKARAIVSQKQKIKKCESMCSALSKVWWSFQARGLISSDIIFPLVKDQCDLINGTEFGNLAWDAHLRSIGRFDKSQQRRKTLVNLYLQAPLSDRIKVRDLLMKDFELYGYDPQPPDLFPEFGKTDLF